MARYTANGPAFFESRQISRHIGGTPHSYLPSGAAKSVGLSHLVTVAALTHIERKLLFKRKLEKTGLTYLNPLFSMSYLFKRKPEMAATKTKGPDKRQSLTPTENPQSLPAIVQMSPKDWP